METCECSYTVNILSIFGGELLKLGPSHINGFPHVLYMYPFHLLSMHACHCFDHCDYCRVSILMSRSIPPLNGEFTVL